MSLEELEARIVECRRCPRLVEWRERVAREKRAAFRDEEYWGRPIPGFGDPGAAVYVLGLAPAAHGANRTGRIFTGDRSGDWLFASMHRTASPTSPPPSPRRRTAPERPVDRGRRALRAAGQQAHHRGARALPALRPRGAGADRALRAPVPGPVRLERGDDAAARAAPPRPRFGHGAEFRPPAGPVVLGSFHPSQQNTFTGRLTEAMTDEVLLRARELAGLP